MTDNAYHYLGMNFRQQRVYKERIRKRDNYTCQLCGQPGKDVDHIIPYHVSHDSSESNLRTLCHPCNLLTRRKRKGNTIPADQYQDYLINELAKYEQVGENLGIIPQNMPEVGSQPYFHSPSGETCTVLAPLTANPPHDTGSPASNTKQTGSESPLILHNIQMTNQIRA